MVHVLGLENGVHKGDCNLLISQWIAAGSAGVQGSHVGQMPVSKGCFSNRTVQNIPQLCTLSWELLGPLGILFRPSWLEHILKGPKGSGCRLWEVVVFAACRDSVFHCLGSEK